MCERNEMKVIKSRGWQGALWQTSLHTSPPTPSTHRSWEAELECPGAQQEPLICLGEKEERKPSAD